MGLVLVVLNFGFFGAVAQLAGFLLIFRSFLPDLYDYICKTPVIGSYLSTFPPTQRATGCRTPSTASPATRKAVSDCTCS